jgi:hypothetical protein
MSDLGHPWRPSARAATELAVLSLLMASGPGAAAGGRQGESAAALPEDLRALPSVLIAHKGQYRMHLFVKGKRVKTYVISLGQSPVGPKRQKGDNRTPEGRYRIIQKAEGPFPGAYGPFLGPRWLRLDYPNEDDAATGLRQGLITPAEAEAIRTAIRGGRQPPGDTRLGGGIGIHGWFGRWPGDDRQNLTWGCISVQNDDLKDLYERVAVGTVVVIYP